jgi:hypothetical protein
MGVGAQFGWKKESTPGTAVVVDRFYPFISSDFADEQERVEGESQRAGQYGLRDDQTFPVSKGWTGPLDLEVYTKDFGGFLELMGGSVSTSGPTDSLYTHTMTRAATIPAATLQTNDEFLDGTDQAFTYAGGKVTKWKLSFEVGKPVMCTLECAGMTYTTATALASASYTSGYEPLTWAGTAITVGGTSVPMESFTIEHEQALKTDRWKLKGSAARQEPVRSGRYKTTWSAKLDFDSLTQFNRFRASTQATNQAAIVVTATGPTLVGSATYPSLVATLAAARFDSFGKPLKGNELIMCDVGGAALDSGSTASVQLVYSNSQSTA